MNHTASFLYFKRFRLMAARLITSLFLTVLFSSLAASEEVAVWKVIPSVRTVKAGEIITIRISATIDSNWHIYSTKGMDEGPEPTTFEILEGKDFIMKGKPRQPKPIVKFDEAFQINTEYYEGSVTFTQDILVKPQAIPGTRKVTVGITFMACSDRLCLPPKTVEAAFEILVEASEQGTQEVQIPDSTGMASTEPEVHPKESSGDEAPVAEDSEPPAGKSGLAAGDAADIEQAREEGFWAFIGLAMSIGALTLLTPCVFPMIPITVSFFTKRPTISRSRGILDASIYSLGIIFTYTVLGLLIAITLGATGLNQFAASPWLNIFIAGVFIVFALNLFGMFEIAIPSSILTKLSAKSQQGGGIISLLLMGLTFTLTSFTCTVPFVGAILVAAAQGDIWWSVLGMLAFSAAFAFPFFLLALFPSWLKSLPRSGGWLNSIKVVMGFLELAAALKFISNVDLVWGLGLLSRDMFLALWIAIGIITAVYLLGKIRLPHDTPVESMGVIRMMWVIFFIGISVFLYTGLRNNPLGTLDAFLPPAQTEEVWMENYDKALNRSRQEGKPIFIDFTGYTCTNCRWMEANIFTREDIKNLMEKYILVRLFTDGTGEEYEQNQAFQERRFGTVALPFYVVMNQDDIELARFPGLTRRPEEFRQFLEHGINAFEKRVSRREASL